MQRPELKILKENGQFFFCHLHQHSQILLTYFFFLFLPGLAKNELNVGHGLIKAAGRLARLGKRP